jgi:hypothetical protein
VDFNVQSSRGVELSGTRHETLPLPLPLPLPLTLTLTLTLAPSLTRHTPRDRGPRAGTAATGRHVTGVARAR